MDFIPPLSKVHTRQRREDTGTVAYDGDGDEGPFVPRNRVRFRQSIVMTFWALPHVSPPKQGFRATRVGLGRGDTVI
jgi:hypothetical protein